MFFLYSMMKDASAIDTSGNLIEGLNLVKISNGIFNHLTLYKNLYLSDDNFDKEINEEWTNDTLLNANFDYSIDAGTINRFVGQLDHLEIQRKVADDDSAPWITLQKIYRKVTVIDGVTEYSIDTNFRMEDSLGQQGIKYTYQVIPVDVNGNYGYAIQKDVLSMFNGAYLADASHIYNITCEYGRVGNRRNQISAVYNPYGAKKPIVAYNAETNYDEGSITAVLLAPTSMSAPKAYLDRYAQKKLVDEFNSWLTNGEAKILKDFNGEFKVITIINPVANDYVKELGNGLASFSFDFVEVGEFTQKDLERIGLVNKFKIEKKS